MCRWCVGLRVKSSTILYVICAALSVTRVTYCATSDKIDISPNGLLHKSHILSHGLRLAAWLRVVLSLTACCHLCYTTVGMPISYVSVTCHIFAYDMPISYVSVCLQINLFVLVWHAQTKDTTEKNVVDGT